MEENELSRIVVNTCYEIHTKMGPGLFESVYEEILNYELNKVGLFVERQKPIPVFWDGRFLELGFRIDLLINSKLLIEIKSIEKLAPVHYKQVQTYLKLTNVKLGLLVNFNEALIKDGMHRVVNRL